MKISIPYKKENIIVDVDENKVLHILEPNEVETKLSEQKLIEQTLFDNSELTQGENTFHDFLSIPGSLLVLVNDGTRPTPTKSILEAISDLLEAHRAEFLIATGAHRKPTLEEYQYIFGDTYEQFKKNIHVHEAKRYEDMESIGTSSNGTEILINKLALKADKLLVIGSVEPHYFAGYTGGRKSILPGIVSYKTIEQNHKLALSPKAKTLVLQDNPVHEDMQDALKIIEKPMYSIMTVLDRNHKIFSVSAGDIEDSFLHAVKKANEVYVVDVEKKADIVVVAAKYPMDVDLYQAQKAIENAKLVLKEGGTMILVASCREGIGEMAFYDLLRSSNSPEEVFTVIKDNYKLGYHKAAKIAEVLSWANILAFSELEDDVLNNIFISPVKDLQKVIDDQIALAEEKHGRNISVLFLLDGGVTVPNVKNST